MQAITAECMQAITAECMIITIMVIIIMVIIIIMIIINSKKWVKGIIIRAARSTLELPEH